MLADRYSFVALFDYADDGISIEFPDLPGCLSCADKNDTNTALSRAKEVLGLYLYGLEEDNEPIPSPSKVTDLDIESSQVAVLVDVFMPPMRERINNRFVKKTLSLPSWLAARADEDGVNCSKIFQNALMEYLGIKQAEHK